MGKTFTNSRNCVILGVILFVAIFAVGLGSFQVSADPCAAQLSYPIVTQQYYGSNVLVTVPVSATCSFQTGQLYAVGTAYDATYNSNVGTANTVLSAIYGGNSFSGQLQFTFPILAQADSVQFSVSIYNAQTGYSQPQPYYGGSLLTTTSATFTLTPSNYQGSYPYPTYPTYPTYPSYPSYNYYYGSYPYPYYNQNPGNNYYYSHYNNGGHYYNNNNGGHYYNNYGHCNSNNCHP